MDTRRGFKVLKKGWKHYDHQYALGTNVLDGEFRDSGECSAGGLYYFLDARDVGKWWERCSHADVVCDVEVPDGARVHLERNGKGKADRIVLSNPRKLMKFVDEHRLDSCDLVSTMSLRYDWRLVLRAYQAHLNNGRLDDCVQVLASSPRALMHMNGLPPRAVLEPTLKANSHTINYIQHSRRRQWMREAITVTTAI